MLNGKTTLKWERVVVELDKCDLLCANCHMEVEDEIYQNRRRPKLGRSPDEGEIRVEFSAPVPISIPL